MPQARGRGAVTAAHHVIRSLARGIVLRCPACGAGRLSDGLLATRDACAQCGAIFEPGRGEFTGALMFAWGIVGLVALTGFFVLHEFFDVPSWAEWAWLLGAAVLLPLLGYRQVKGAWIGAMYAARGPIRRI